MYLSLFCEVTTMDYNQYDVNSPSPLLWVFMILVSVSFYIIHRYNHSLFRIVTLPYLVILFFFLWFYLAYVLTEEGFAIPRTLSFIILAGVASIPRGISRLVDLLPDPTPVDPVTPTPPPTPSHRESHMENTDIIDEGQANPENGTVSSSSDSHSSTGSTRDESPSSFSSHAPITTSSAASTNDSLPRERTAQVISSYSPGSTLPSIRILRSTSPMQPRSSSPSLSPPSSPLDSYIPRFTVPDSTPSSSPYLRTLQWVMKGSEESPPITSPPSSPNPLTTSRLHGQKRRRYRT